MALSNRHWDPYYTSHEMGHVLNYYDDDRIGRVPQRRIDPEAMKSQAQRDFERAQLEADETARKLELARIKLEAEQVRQGRIDAVGEDDYEDTCVIRFDKRFTDSGRVYSYTAIKCGDQWYTSGPKAPGPYSWEQLARFLSQGVEQLWVVDS